MKKQVLFIQGGGDDGYKADANLVTSLQKMLGSNYKLNYPRLQTDNTVTDFGWPKQIGQEIGKLRDKGILVAHSLGASLLLKYLTENVIVKKIAGIFLLSTPFWSGDEEWKQGLKLRQNFEKAFPKDSRIFFYQCRDDEEVPFDHFAIYQDKLPRASFREIERGGHQLGDSLALVADDIKGL